jgi:PTH1 family peptidyl-tRNA hydrolase
MAFLQRRPQVSDPVNYVTLGLSKTYLLVGLGNIGKQYDGTRHNVGFACADEFVQKSNLGGWTDKKDLKCQLASGQLGEARIIVIKPTTLMNLSGEAVQAVVHFYKIPIQQVVVIHDELDVNFGQIRTRIGGSSAGHNGIKSVTKLLGSEDYGRVRIGIGPKQPAQIDSADFVLQAFSKAEQTELPALRKEATAILSEYAYSGQLPADTRSFIF